MPLGDPKLNPDPYSGAGFLSHHRAHLSLYCLFSTIQQSFWQWWKCSVFSLSNTVVTSHTWLLRAYNLASAKEELKFQFLSFFFKSNSYTCLVATIMGSAVRNTHFVLPYSCTCFIPFRDAWETLYPCKRVDASAPGSDLDDEVLVFDYELDAK